MKKIFFVTGTDTDVGKTYLSCGILDAAKRAGFSTAAVKPVAAGGIKTQQGVLNEDALALQKNCSMKLAYQQVNPVVFDQAIAPHIAAQQNNVCVEARQLVEHCRKIISLNADITIIEGAGGWKVPLNRTELISDVVKELNIPVILVVAMQLGCINHALLTEQAIVMDGLKVTGWIANQVQANMHAYRDNLNTLKQRLTSPFLSEVLFDAAFSEDSNCATQINLNKIMAS